MIQAISLVGFKKAEEVLALIMEYDDPAVQKHAHFELSYQLEPRMLRDLKPIVTGRVISVHAGCPSSSVFPNLASSDPAVLTESNEILEDSMATARSFGASILVMYPGYVMDRAMPVGNLERQSLLNSEEFAPFIWRKEGAICNREYIDTPEYWEYFDRAAFQLGKFAKKCKENGLKLAIENQNLRVGYLCHTAVGMERLVEASPDIYLCLDVGHLWISSCLYGFDFINTLQRIVDTGRVAISHLHSNRSCPDKNVDGKFVKGVFKDDHATFDRYGFPCESVVRILMNAGVDLVLETMDDPLYNMNLLDRLVLANYR